MSAPDKADPEPPAADPDALAKALELELIAQRASWQKMRARRGMWLTLSFVFLFLVLLGALMAYFYFSMEMNHRGEESPAARRIESER